MFGISLPSVSDVTRGVTSAASSALHGAEDLGDAAVTHASSLGRAGLDLGRSAITAVSHVDVQKLGASAIGAIGKVEHAADQGIRSGVLSAGQGVHALADAARSHVTGNDPLSRLARAGITAQEDLTRFDIGVIGGVGRAAVGLVGSAGQLGVMAAEYQASPAARAAIDAKVGGAVVDGAKSAAGYAESVARDPSRVVGDATAVAHAGIGWAKGEVNSAEQAIKEGHGPESFGMEAGNAATYLIPVGGEVRLAAEGGELATRALVTTVVDDGVRATVKDGGEAVVRDGAAEASAEASQAAAAAPTAAADALPPISAAARAAVPDAARRTGLSESKITELLETPKLERPPATDYLSSSYTADHLAQWSDGAVRFTSRESYAEWGTLGPPSTFTLPASRFGELVKSSGGDMSKVEQQLGLDPGYLSNADTMIVHVERGDLGNLHIPSGAERGAGEHWVPGGYTSGGVPEAVADLPKGTPFTEITLAPKGN